MYGSYGCSEFIRIPKSLTSSALRNNTAAVKRSIWTAAIKTTRPIQPVLPSFRCIAASQHHQSIRSLHVKKQSDSSDKTSLSDIHTWIQQHTTSHQSKKPVVAASKSSNTSAIIQQYLSSTRSTYTHLLDLKYRLHRVLGDIEIDIVIDYNPLNAPATSAAVASSVNTFTVMINSKKERMQLTCSPVFASGALMRTGLSGLVRITDLRTGERHDIAASAVNEQRMLSFFTAIGIDASFMQFVQAHEQEVMRDLEYNGSALYEHHCLWQ